MVAATEPAPDRWLHGRTLDLMVGCGGCYAILFLGLVALGPAIRENQPTILFPLLNLVGGFAHYGATLLRVYEDRDERRRYYLFSLWATAAIAAAFTAGVWISAVGVVLVTIYLTWSPWHYTGQNYGIAVMMLRRGGVALADDDKRWLYASFILSYAIVLLVMHADVPTTGSEAAGTLPLIRFQPVGIPAAIGSTLVPLVGAAYVVSSCVAATRLVRMAGVRIASPALLLLLTQALWFSVPFALLHLGIHPVRVEALDWDFRSHYFLWIAAGHFFQYLWVTSYFAKRSEGSPSIGRWYLKVLAAGCAAWVLPALLFGPIGIGALSMDLGLALLVASAVNIHHFVLDGAIWKLRGRIADILIRSRPPTIGTGPRATSRGWTSKVVWALCGVATLVNVFNIAQHERVRSAQRQADLSETRRAWDALARTGHDESNERARLGYQFLGRGQADAAIRQFNRSLELGPKSAASAGLARIHFNRSEWAKAAAIAEEGLEHSPDNLALLVRAAAARRMGGEPAAALRWIEYAERLAPEDESVRDEAEHVRSALSAAPN